MVLGCTIYILKYDYLLLHLHLLESEPLRTFIYIQTRCNHSTGLNSVQPVKFSLWTSWSCGKWRKNLDIKIFTIAADKWSEPKNKHTAKFCSRNIYIYIYIHIVISECRCDFEKYFFLKFKGPILISIVWWITYSQKWQKTPKQNMTSFQSPRWHL